LNAFNSNPKSRGLRGWWGRIAIASVWLYEGLWCKILGGAPHQEAVATSISRSCSLSPKLALVAIGVGECAIAAWVLSARRRRAAAVIQTVLLAGMNTAGLIWARQFIPDPAGMVVQNFAFLTLVWHAIYL
jgi:hypothetical protein